jgi:anti-anti-sigma factor
MLEQADLRVIRLEGELDLHTARGLAAGLSQAVGDITHEPVVDLRDVTFMDSSALATVAKAAEQLRRQGRALGLVITDGPVSSLLDVTGMRDRFELLSELPENAAGSTPAPEGRGGRFAR